MDKIPFAPQSRIKNLRELRNYTQDYMADKLKISQNTYSRLEAGQVKLTIERVNEIAEILEVTFWELVNEQPVFNIWNNEVGVGGHIGKFYQNPVEVYESTISLLKEEIVQLREEKRQLFGLLEKMKL
jgi:transcriptional regulator with XRE-family HTH domain